MVAKAVKKSRPNIRIILIAVVAVLAIAYIGVGIYYNGHFFPKTTVGGISCGNEDADYVESQNIAAAQSYVLTVTDRKDTQFTIAGSQISYAYKSNGEEAALLKAQNGFTWPVGIFLSHEYDLDRSFTYDSQALSDAIDALEMFDDSYIEKPENAYLKITDDDYEVVEQVEGNSPIRDTVISEIAAAIDAQQDSLVLSDDCYEKPEIYSDDESISKTASQLDTYAASTVTYTIEGADEVLDRAKILSMLDIDDNGDVSVNEEALTKYVQYLASTYNTYGKVRNFKTSKGDTIQIGGGTYGYVLSKSGEKAQLLENLAGGTPIEREPVYELRGLHRGDNDIGDTYVEIDYTNQHLWFYKDGELVTDTDIVSGNISRGNGSSDGIFPVGYKARNQTLVGENYSSDVDYFIQFSYNVGIHDASWRSTFGGQIYKTSGSHGCINVPLNKATKIYENIEAGTPVVAYYRENVKLSAYNNKLDNAYSYAE
jgi:hypothetical protein